uniref:DUF1156 domain-containing protein n=1 Tax=Staphylothermus marinus TaxID=2280 RepID=A0A7C4NQ26_STAMA
MGGVLNRFIESPLFPINDINVASAAEKRGGGRPDFWEMVFWWTRKPLISARAVIAGALLPDNTTQFEFKQLIKLWSHNKTPHRDNPSISPQFRERFVKIKLLDPFAGFGSIPLEAVRLGLGKVTAVELLPTAYVFLKAVLEYPRFGERLIRDIEYWGKWVVDKLREDPDIRELYDDDVAVYIGSWEIKCPYCGNYTPLVGNWWLARVSGKESEDESEEESVKRRVFDRLVWMEPYRISNYIGIKIIDLNREFNKKEINAKINTKQGYVEAYGRTYNVPKPNIEAKRGTAICLICNNTIRKTSKNGEWYVKKTIREYNDALEKYFRGEINLEELLSSRARPRLLVKVKIDKTVNKGKTLEFEPATQQDNEKLWKALEKLKQIWGDPDIPTEPTPPYGNVGGGLRFPVDVAEKWYQFFNPRQLLTLVKLVKLIREAGKMVEEENLKQGWDKEKAHKYAEAVTTYLAIALVRYATFSSIVSPVRADTIMGAVAAGALSFRGIAMVWNWCELSPTASITGSFLRNISTVNIGIKYLINAVSGSSSSVEVVLDDATVLGRLGGEKFDLIVTDPPYRDDVAYAELSDFYYVWLKRALCDVGDVYGVLKLVPRFHKEAFFDEFGNEVEVQWRVFALREVSENVGRFRYFGVKEGGLEYFKSLLAESFKTMASRLVDDGLLTTYYAHTSPDAWEALLEAGWLYSKMRITSAYAIATESTESVVARGKIRLDMAIVAVWRKGVSGEALVDEVYAEAVESCSRDALNYRKAGLNGVDLFVAVLGKVLSHFTRYERLIGIKTSAGSLVGELVEKYIYPATAEAIARSFGAVGAKLTPPSMFYLLSKVLIGRRARQSRRVIDRTSSVILAIGTRCSLDELERLRIVVRDREADKHVLLEPKWGVRNPRESIEDVLNAKYINPSAPTFRTAVDLLHLLEYYAITLPKEEFRRRVEDIRGRAPMLFDEAVNLVKILAQGLVDEDPEKELVRKVMEGLEIRTPGTLEHYY